MVVDTERARRRRRLHGAHARRRRPLPLLRRVDRLPAGRPTPRPIGADTREPRRARRPARRQARRRRARSRRARCARLPGWTPEPRQLAVDRARSTSCGSARRPASVATRSSRSPRSSIRSTPCSTGTASTAPADSCSTSSSCRTAQRTSCARARAAERAPVPRRSSRCSKRFEHDSRSMLGFPASRMDARARHPRGGRRAREPLLDGLDELVVERGRPRRTSRRTRRLRAELVPAMYPQLDRWREVRATLDPATRSRSDMDRRLDSPALGRRPQPAVTHQVASAAREADGRPGDLARRAAEVRARRRTPTPIRRRAATRTRGRWSTCGSPRVGADRRSGSHPNRRTTRDRIRRCRRRRRSSSSRRSAGARPCRRSAG